MVLDTHVLVWLMQEPGKIGRQALAAIEHAVQDGPAYIPAITTWEISMLACRNKLQLGDATGSWIARAMADGRVQIAPLSADIALDAGCLPGEIHGDPADCMIVATARAMRLPLVTADRKILDYAAAGHLQAIDARR